MKKKNQPKAPTKATVKKTAAKPTVSSPATSGGLPMPGMGRASVKKPTQQAAPVHAQAPLSAQTAAPTHVQTTTHTVRTTAVIPRANPRGAQQQTALPTTATAAAPVATAAAAPVVQTPAAAPAVAVARPTAAPVVPTTPVIPVAAAASTTPVVPATTVTAPPPSQPTRLARLGAWIKNLFTKQATPAATTTTAATVPPTTPPTVPPGQAAGSTAGGAGGTIPPPRTGFNWVHLLVRILAAILIGLVAWAGTILWKRYKNSIEKFANHAEMNAQVGPAATAIPLQATNNPAATSTPVTAQGLWPTATSSGSTGSTSVQAPQPAPTPKVETVQTPPPPVLTNYYNNSSVRNSGGIKNSAVVSGNNNKVTVTVEKKGFELRQPRPDYNGWPYDCHPQQTLNTLVEACQSSTANELEITIVIPVGADLEYTRPAEYRVFPKPDGHKIESAYLTEEDGVVGEYIRKRDYIPGETSCRAYRVHNLDESPARITFQMHKSR